ncbi:hypothetical protein VCJ71_02020 [Alteriqipengyuania sp. WL0013]|uniref:hypothetical protein n=1 Tax=Alteriqipengyuania sp. WL0013 TaxID=3110773 RepID=UPI002C846FD0|nr:hypothetical protein [Alteriqipengyuania sp. WL0013]MEB3414836.1 hypothetical protein [Alteriqipengyuania sp. WL0013]
MRIALLTLPVEEAGTVRVLGRALAEWQCEMALALGCERILLVAPALTGPALDIQHQAEAGEAKFQIVPHAHRLLGQLKTDDELLILDPALLVRGEAAREMLDTPRRIFVMPETAGESGFERLDRETLWAGAAWLPGAMLERLADLDSDAEPASALLRIAAGLGVRRQHLRDEALGKADWAALHSQQDGLEVGREITTDRLGAAPVSPGDWLAHRLVRQWLVNGQAAGRVGRIAAGIAAVLFAGAIVLLALGFALYSVPLAGLAWFAGTILAHSGKVSGWKRGAMLIVPLASLGALAAALAVILARSWTWTIAGFVTAMVVAWAIEAVRGEGSSGSWLRDGVFLAVVIGVTGALDIAFLGAAGLIALAIGAIWAARLRTRS